MLSESEREDMMDAKSIKEEVNGEEDSSGDVKAAGKKEKKKDKSGDEGDKQES